MPRRIYFPKFVGTNLRIIVGADLLFEIVLGYVGAAATNRSSSA